MPVETLTAPIAFEELVEMADEAGIKLEIIECLENVVHRPAQICQQRSQFIFTANQS